MNKKVMIGILALLIVIIVGVLVHFLFSNNSTANTPTETKQFEYDKEENIKSPSGKNTVTLKYDNISRPYIFKDNKMIFKYDGPGFNETVYWDVEWIAEDKILLYLKSPQKEKYNNEKYYINID